MLPVSFLRQLIGMYGNSMQAMMPHYLEASMENFRANQRKLQDAFKTAMGSDAVRQDGRDQHGDVQGGRSAFMPGQWRKGKDERRRSRKPQDDELAALREQMAEMQKKLDALGK